MNNQPLRYRRSRIILDCVLIALILLLASTSPSTPAGQASTADPVMSTHPPAGNPPPPTSPQLDNDTLAAIIAAENAALTVPMWFVDLPITVR